MTPVIALVGRPNVGKSTLFNRITRSRDAIVADYAGLTRDRHYGKAKFGEFEYLLIDTGGFEPKAETGIYKEMAKQTKQAVYESDIVFFLVDAREGLSAQDYDIASFLRKLDKKIFLLANKAEGLKDSGHLAQFYELGLGDVIAVSASHGHGVKAIIEQALENLLVEFKPPAEEVAPDVIRLAVAGRPNVGKSTLINCWLGEERLVSFDLPGTTRDAITVSMEKNGQHFELVDTAGLRKKGKVFEAIEKFSVIKTLQAIETANVVLLLLDATQGVTEQDSHIAGFILESGRAVVLAVNKIDAIDDYQKEQLKRSIELRLGFLKFAQCFYISATKRHGLAPLWQALLAARKSAMCNMPTPKLTRLLQAAVEHQAPKRDGMYRPKMRYAHQGGVNPPVVVIHGNSLEHITPSYKRYLEGYFRKAFELTGTPLQVEFRSTRNPYSKKN